MGLLDDLKWVLVLKSLLKRSKPPLKILWIGNVKRESGVSNLRHLIHQGKIHLRVCSVCLVGLKGLTLITLKT